MKHIRNLAAEVGAQDGQGAYAELGALDFVGRMYKTVIGTPAFAQPRLTDHQHLRSNCTNKGQCRWIDRGIGHIL